MEWYLPPHGVRTLAALNGVMWLYSDYEVRGRRVIYITNVNLAIPLYTQIYKVQKNLWMDDWVTL